MTSTAPTIATIALHPARTPMPVVHHNNDPRSGRAVRMADRRMRGLAERWHRLFRIARLRPSACVGADGIRLPGRMNVTTNVTTHGLATNSGFANGDRASLSCLDPSFG